MGFELTLGRRALITSACFTAIAVAMGGAAHASLRTVAHHLVDVATVQLVGVAAIGTVGEQTEVAQGALSALLLPELDDSARSRSLREESANAIRLAEQAMATLEGLEKSPETARLWAQVTPAFAAWATPARELLGLIAEQERSGGAASAERAARREGRWRIFQRVLDAMDPLDEKLGKAGTAVRQEARAAADEGLSAQRTAGAVLIAAAVAACTLAILLAAALSRAVRRTVSSLVRESGKLTGAVMAGRLDARGDLTAVSAEFRPLVSGMNETMDAFARPLAQSRDYMERISQGDVPPKITDEYRGDFDRTKQALNRCIEAVSSLVQDANALAGAAIEGKLSSRADAGRHQGDFRKVVQGVNQTLDAVLAPVQEARSVLERLADRDLTARVQGSYQGDHAAIKEAINSASRALHDALGQVADAVGQVSSAATQIASSSQAVASGASEQASSLEETHSSLETMSAQTRQASDNAQQANSLAAETRRSAEEGAAAMAQMTGAMNKIRRSAEGTSAIIKDISEIAFQTNLLALNAAVEAARAGEAGRGFAVVAEEVRSLALRAKEAAIKTEELIKESVKQAGEGEAVAKVSSGKLGEIVGSAQKVSDIVAEMAASAREQAAGIEQVSRAVGEMDKVTQQNAASSEESSSAAEELSTQSEELAAMVGAFTLSRAPSARKPQAAAPRRSAPLAAAKAKARNGAGARASIPLRPEEAIPLGSDPAFSDF